MAVDNLQGELHMGVRNLRPYGKACQWLSRRRFENAWVDEAKIDEAESLNPSIPFSEITRF